ncbi:MAG: hypothetical protein PHE21_03300 [Candidatus Dojkabacteria bacterium]|nr:hypothetical protein [Candidatus Dojkabacteria bacterium]
MAENITAFDGAAETYDKSIANGISPEVAKENASKEGGIENYSKSLGDETLKPFIEKDDYNPVTAENVLTEIGLDTDTNVLNRYSEYGKYKIETLNHRLSILKNVYNDFLFNNDDNVVNTNIEDYVDREMITEKEYKIFSDLRKAIIKENNPDAIIEGRFLTQLNNEERGKYLDNLIKDNTITSEKALNIANSYGLKYNPSIG